MKLPLFSIIAALFVQMPVVAFAQGDIQKEMRMMNRGTAQEEFIGKFALQAKDKDSATILKEMDSLILKANGEEASSRWLQAEIFPFFDKFSKLHNYKQITNAVLPDGRSGFWHYTFIVDTDGKVRPFSIAIIESSEGPRILNIIVNQCVKGRHPAIAPCSSDATTSSQPQGKPVSKDDETSLNTRKLVALDVFSIACSAIDAEWSGATLANFRQRLFPQGEPLDASSLRQNILYKDLYEKGMAMSKNFTKKECEKL